MIKCSKCGTILEDGITYCNTCFNKIENESNIMQQNEITSNIPNSFLNEEQRNQNVIDNNDDFNERFIKAYIGKKADKMYKSIKNNGVNIWAIIFGIYYFIYRKMYLISIIIMISGEIIGNLFPSTFRYLANFIGLLFCPIYKWHITKKLRKIKKSNPTADKNELINIAQKKGGTSIIGVAIYIIIYFTIINLFYALLSMLVNIL